LIYVYARDLKEKRGRGRRKNIIWGKFTFEGRENRNPIQRRYVTARQ